jgi:hypothetical protein
MTNPAIQRITVNVLRYQVDDDTIADKYWSEACRAFKSLTTAERYARREVEAARNRHPDNYVEAVITGFYYELWDWHPAWNGYLRYDDDIEWVDADSNTLIARPS